MHTRQPSTLTGTGAGSTAPSDPSFVICSEAIPPGGRLLNLYDSGGGVQRVRLADVDLGRPAHGYAAGDYANGTTVTVFPLDGKQVGVAGATSVHADYYLSTEGTVTTSPHGKKFIQKVGHSLSAGTMVLFAGQPQVVALTAGASGGVVVNTFAADPDPANLPDGFFFYHSGEEIFKGVAGGAIIDFSGGAGTVTSVAVTVPTGMEIASGSPITGAGTIAIVFSTGYSIPLTADTAKGVTAHGWGNHASAGYLTSSAIDSLAELNAIVGVTLIESTNPALTDARTPLSHSHGNIANGGTIGTTANLPVITGASGILQAGAFGTGATDFCVGNDARLSDSRTPLSHAHGNIANGGTVGTTANLPLITGTAGIVQVGAFGTGATDFCVGNDARLSDARTPLSHAHGNIANGGTIGSTANLPIITGTAGILQAGAFGTGATDFCVGNDARLSDARTPTSHAHGNIANGGTIGTTANLPIITGTAGILQVGAFGTGSTDFCVGNDARLSDARAPTSHTHTASEVTDFSTAADARISAAVGVSVQAYDADLTTWASLTPSANAQSLVTAANYAAMRALLDLEAGTDFYSIAAADAAFQPLDAQLTSLAGLSFAGNSLKAVRLNAGETAFEFFTLSGGGDAQTANPLSQFAATTSAQLRGVLSDELGTGAALFDGAALATGLTFPLAGMKVVQTGGTYVVTQQFTTTGAADHTITWTVPSGASSAYTLPASGTLVADGNTLSTGFVFPNTGMKLRDVAGDHNVTVYIEDDHTSSAHTLGYHLHDGSRRFDLSGDLVIGSNMTFSGVGGGNVNVIIPTSGTLLNNSNNLSDVSNAATAFANIKQAATTSATGVVELATDGENAADKVVQGNDGRVNDSVLTVRMRTTDGATALTAGQIFYCYIPFDCTLSTTADIVSPTSGSAVFDIWEDTYANWPPVVGDSKVSSGKPTLSSATKSQTTVTWVSSSLTKGKYLAVKLDSVTTCYELILSIPVTKT